MQVPVSRSKHARHRYSTPRTNFVFAINSSAAVRIFAINTSAVIHAIVIRVFAIYTSAAVRIFAMNRTTAVRIFAINTTTAVGIFAMNSTAAIRDMFWLIRRSCLARYSFSTCRMFFQELSRGASGIGTTQRLSMPDMPGILFITHYL